MMRVKICGLTRPEDVDAAVAAGADAVGFINVPGGPRYLPPAAIAQLALRLPPFVVSVAVVDLTDPLDRARVAALKDLVRRGVRCIQFHGHEPPWEVRRWRDLLGVTAIKAIKLQRRSDLDSLAHYEDAVNAFLLDGGGGQGIACDWELAAEAKSRTKLPVILAGGLDPENVAEAAAKVRPYAVDVASGVEQAPGVKDPARLASFIAAAQSIGPFTPPCPEGIIGRT